MHFVDAKGILTMSDRKKTIAPEQDSGAFNMCPIWYYYKKWRLTTGHEGTDTANK